MSQKLISDPAGFSNQTDTTSGVISKMMYLPVGIAASHPNVVLFFFLVAT